MKSVGCKVVGVAGLLGAVACTVARRDAEVVGEITVRTGGAVAAGAAHDVWAAAPDAGGPVWALIDPGSGGALPAVAVGPATVQRDGGIVSIESTNRPILLGSDVGAMRASTFGAPETFSLSVRGFELTAFDPPGAPTRVLLRRTARNMAQVDVEPREVGTPSGTPFVAWATSRAGIVYRSTDSATTWQPVLDASTPSGQAVFGTTSPVPFGPVASSLNAGSHTIMVGVGRYVTMLENSEALIDLGVAAHSVVVTRDGGSTWSKVDVCPACSTTAHVTGISPTASADVFWVSTTEGLFRLRYAGGIWASLDRSGDLPTVLRGGHNVADVRDVAVNAKGDGNLVVLLANPTAGLVYWTNQGNMPTTSWTNATGNLPEPSAGIDRTYARLARSRSNPREVVVMGTKTGTRGIYMTREVTRDVAGTPGFDTIWESVVQSTDVADTLVGEQTWSRFPTAQPLAFQGPVGMAIAEGPLGIERVYAAGWSGNLVRADRSPTGFTFRGLTSQNAGPGLSTQISQAPLQVSTGVVVDRAVSGPAIFLFADNGFFVSEDRGVSFRHPLERWAYGTGADINLGKSVVTFMRGTDIEAPVADGFVSFSADGRAFRDYEMTNFPSLAAPTFPVLSPNDGSLLVLARGHGVFRHAASFLGAWSPETMPAGQDGGAPPVTDSDLRWLFRDIRSRAVGPSEAFVFAVGQSGSAVAMRSLRPPSNRSAWTSIDLRYGGSPFQRSVVEAAVLIGELWLVTAAGDLFSGPLPAGIGDPPAMIAPIDLSLVPAPSKAYAVPTPDAGVQTQTLRPRIFGLGKCGSAVYAATADGLWKLAGGTWSPIATPEFRALAGISLGAASGGACDAYLQADGSGGVYVGRVDDR